MLRLQQYEKLIKVLVAEHSLSGPVKDWEQIRTEQMDGTARKTLGSLVGELIGSYVVAGEIRSPDDAMLEPPKSPDAPARGTMHMSIGLPPTVFAQIEVELKEMVDLRNNMVHHFINQHDFTSSDGCRGAQVALNAAYSVIDRHFAQLREWAEDMENIRSAAAEFMQTQDFKDYVIDGIRPDGTVDWFAAGIVCALRQAFKALAVKGWAPLAEAEKWINARHPEQLPTKYGCRSWRQVVHNAPDLELRYFVIDGDRSAFYRPQTPSSRLHRNIVFELSHASTNGS